MLAFSSSCLSRFTVRSHCKKKKRLFLLDLLSFISTNEIIYGSRNVCITKPQQPTLTVRSSFLLLDQHMDYFLTGDFLWKQDMLHFAPNIWSRTSQESVLKQFKTDWLAMTEPRSAVKGRKSHWDHSDPRWTQAVTQVRNQLYNQTNNKGKAWSHLKQKAQKQ